jgi:hypothetical protein
MMGKSFWNRPWKFSPPAETCHVWDPPESMTPCGKPATHAYPAMGGGYASLCADHSGKHRTYIVTIEQARLGMVPAGSADS